MSKFLIGFVILSSFLLDTPHYPSGIIKGPNQNYTCVHIGADINDITGEEGQVFCLSTKFFQDIRETPSTVEIISNQDTLQTDYYIIPSLIFNGKKECLPYSFVCVVEGNEIQGQKRIELKEDVRIHIPSLPHCEIGDLKQPFFVSSLSNDKVEAAAFKVIREQTTDPQYPFLEYFLADTHLDIGEILQRDNGEYFICVPTPSPSLDSPYSDGSLLMKLPSW